MPSSGWVVDIIDPGAHHHDGHVDALTLAVHCMFGQPYKCGAFRATSDHFEMGESERYGSDKYSGNPIRKACQKGTVYIRVKGNNEMKPGMGEANSAMCRHIRAGRSGAGVAVGVVFRGVLARDLQYCSRGCSHPPTVPVGRSNLRGRCRHPGQM